MATQETLYTTQAILNRAFNPATNQLNINGGGVTPGTTVITSGTDTRVLFDDAGVVNEDAGFTFHKANATGVTTASSLALNATSLTTGTGLYVASSTITSGLLVNLQVSGTVAAASQTALNILTTGATATNAITTYGAKISNTHTNGTSGTNVGLYLNASGATTANYGLIVDGGYVGINTTAPTSRLHIVDTLTASISISSLIASTHSGTNNTTEIGLSVSMDATGLVNGTAQAILGKISAISSTNSGVASAVTGNAVINLATTHPLVGVRGVASSLNNGGILNTGVFGIGDNGSTTTTRVIGVAGEASDNNTTNFAGGYFWINVGLFGGADNTQPPNFLGKAAIIADNTTSANSIFIAKDNGTDVFTIADGGHATFGEAVNIINGTSTGTKIGTATNQLLGFWNATPIAQPTTGIAASTFAANTSLIANDSATWDSYTIGQVVKALRNAGILA